MVGPFTVLLFWGQLAGAEPQAPAVASEASCHRPGHDATLLAEPVWSEHVVRPRERLGQIAVRYGVTREDLVAWNRLSGPRARVPAGKKLTVLSRRVPPPWESIVYTALAGDTWAEVAVRYKVLPVELKRWNPKFAARPLEPGAKLKIWSDPSAPRTVNCRRGEPPPPLVFRRDAESLGHASGGRLKHGILLPKSPLWKRGKDSGLWLSSHTLATMFEAFTSLRVERGYEGEIFIGSLSRKRGGRFPPHRSHRTGLDIDIRLPLLPSVPPETYPNPDAVDWPALWELIESFLDTGEVSVIFLDRRLQERLYWAARWDGLTHEQLAPVIHWPRKDKKWAAIVRHSRGHKGHIHVRLLCGPQEARCKPARSETLARRGWIEPDPSGKESREGADARREAWLLAGRGSPGVDDLDDDAP